MTYSVSIAPQDVNIAAETGLINWLAPSSYAQPVPTFNNQCYIVPEDIERVGSGDSESAYVLPLFQRVRNAISQGSSFIAPQADAWHRRNGCLGCHVQTQTLLGLQASKAKADVDEEIAEYLLSEILASQQSDGTVRRSHPGHSKNQTAFALWALSYVPDQNRTFDARARGLRYFFGVKQSNGTTTSWGTDHSSGWLRSSDAITGLLSLTASRYLSDAQSQSNLTESQLAVVLDYTEQLPLIVRYFLNNAYNDDANNLIKTFRLIGLAEARKHITDPALLGEVNTAISYIDNLLRSRQKADGGWPVNALQSESDPLTTAWVGFALNYQNPPLTDPVVSNNIEYLLSAQNSDGTWVTNSGLFSTHLATTSLVMAYLPVALEFLGNPDVAVSNILLDDKQLQLSAQINNRGLGDIVVPINVTFYNGHPDQNNPLGSVELSGLESNGSTVTTLDLTTLPDDDVFVVINVTPATPECEVTNNQSVAALVQVNAIDPKGLSDNQTFLINVLDSNEAPTITSQPITSLAQGSAYNYTVTVTDPDNGDAHRFTLPVAPAGLFIDPKTGKFSYDLEQLPVGNHDVTVRVTDLRGLSAEQSFVLTVEANHAPVISSQALTEAQIGQPYQYSVVAEDEDGDSLLYTLRVSPLTMTVNPETGVIDWTPAALNIGEQAVEVLVNDGRGGEAVQLFTINVSDNHPPVITSSPVLMTNVGEHYAYSVIAIDPDNDVLRYELTTFPQGMLISDTGLITFTSTLEQVGQHTVTVQVTDPGGLQASQTYNLSVEANNLPPVITSLPVISTTEIEDYQYQVQATDPNPGDTLTFGLDHHSNGMSINSETGVINWQPDSSFDGTTVAQNNFCVGTTQDISNFEPVLKWEWTGSSVESAYKQVNMAPLVAQTSDDNGDGEIDQHDIPDIIFVAFGGAGANSNGAGILRIISGADGSDLVTGPTTTNLRFGSFANLAVGDIDSDGLIEIVGPKQNGGLVAFNHDGSLLWESLPNNLSGRKNLGGPSIADIDADNIPEIIYGTTVFNADGTIRWEGSNSIIGENHISGSLAFPFSVIADIDDSKPGLELIAGPSAYDASGNLLWRNNALSDGFTAIADFNGNGLPEIVLVSKGTVSLLDHQGQSIWDHISIPGGGNGGTPTIADMDGDGELEIGVVGRSYYVVFQKDGTELWRFPIRDFSSSITGSSVFDFDGNGKVEVVYADETTLRIFDGTTGNVLFSIANSSGTSVELPVIADVDNDGHADIVVAANTYGGGSNTGIRVFEDINNNWAPTRAIWNQHAYSINNINDDGTIPAVPAKSWLTHNTFRLNTFANRDALSLADLRLSDLVLINGNTTDSLQVNVTNRGLAPVNTAVDVEFFNGNPDNGGQPLGTITLESLAVGVQQTVTLTDIAKDSLTDTLYARIDSNQHIEECSELNNSTNAALVNVRVQDQDGLFDVQRYSVNVTNVNQPPVIVSTSTTSVIQGQQYEYSIQITDPDIGDSASYSLLQAPTGMSVDERSGRVTWIPTSTQVGEHTFIVAVDDLEGGHAEQTNTLLVLSNSPLNDPPLIITVPPSTLQSGVFEYDVDAIDADGDVLTYSLQTAPAEMTIDAQTGLVSWTSASTHIGDHPVTIRVTDAGCD